jgi:hypothetical protein
LHIAQHRIELDITIPLAHQARYRMNPNYVAIIKSDLDKLLSTGFIALVEEISWLLLIVVIPKRNDKLKFYVDF